MKPTSILNIGPDRYRVDNRGIIHLDDEDFYYREVPREFFGEILAAGTREETLAAFYRAMSALPVAQRQALRHYVMDPTRAAAAMLGVIGAEHVVLDYGCGWGTITRTVSRFGGTVVAVDATYESLLLSKNLSKQDNELYIKGGRSLPLPFRDECFDTVLLNGVLEWLPEGTMLDKNPRAVQETYLTEFHRILKPGGRLVVAIENRNSFLYWAGQREDHTALRFGALLPRRLSNLYSKSVRGRPYRTYTYTRNGYRRLFSRCGFVRTDIYIPWLRYRRSRVLLSDTAINHYPVTAELAGRTLCGRLAKIILPIVQRVKLLGHFVPDFILVSFKAPHGAEPGRSYLEQIAGASGDPLDRDLVMMNSSVPAFHFVTSSNFYKIPLSDQSLQRLRAEVYALKALKEAHPDLARFVPDPERCRLDPSGRFGCFPRVISLEGRRSWSANERHVREFLRCLWRDAECIKIGESDLGRRLGHPDSWDFILEFAGSVVCCVLERVFDKSAPAGVVHGDFCQQNTILAGSSRLVVIDWDRFEPRSPKFIDPLHWWIDTQTKRSGMSLAQAVKRTGESDPLPPWVSENIRPWMGELSLSEALVLYLADRLTKDVSGHRFGDYTAGYFDSVWENWYRSAFKTCEDALNGKD